VEYLPLFLNLKQQHCLLVGGGHVALRKARLLHQAGASITVVAPDLIPGLESLLAEGRGEIIQTPYLAALLEGKILVVAATDDRALNKQVHDDAVQHNLPVNVVDTPELCTFIFPSIVDRSPIMVAVSSGGQSPVLTRLLRARLETLIPHYYGRLGSLAGRFRSRVKARFTTINERRGFWERVLQGCVADKVLAGREEEAERLMEQLLADSSTKTAPVGEVYLVGAGPGDPELLTFKALRLMQQADVVLYDRLISPEVLDLTRRDADRIYVGKERSNHSVPQEGINELLVRLASEGRRVLRLKGGDPFIFGRGGEELEALAEAGIPFQVVPGITAASACSSYAGIPLTHRDYAQSVRFVTGQQKNRTEDLNWRGLAEDNQTLVIYMGLHRLAHLCQQLITHGKAPTTPVALVQAGSTPEQRVLIGTLETIVTLQESGPLKPPSLIIIGEVVRLHEKLAWYDGVEAQQNQSLLNLGDE
jgi:uroporphyrin-III C-methyltransferase/precorrin-2 dehydrogenase/sirohydrochlorin ferrochelatase